MAGTVVGITTFADQDTSGPGISGIVRIEEVGILLDRAHTKMRDVTPPEAALLPVEPVERYPVDDLKRALRAGKFSARPYMFREGDYDVVIGTPVLKYQLSEGGLVAAERAKERREGSDPDAPQATFRPLEDLKSWEEYVGAYKPLIIIQASPQLRETSKSIVARRPSRAVADERKHPQVQAIRCLKEPIFRDEGPQTASNLRRFNNKPLGVAPDLFTTFGVWSRLWAGDMVSVQMRFAHRFDPQGGQRSTNCLRPDGPGTREPHSPRREFDSRIPGPFGHSPGCKAPESSWWMMSRN